MRAWVNARSPDVTCADAWHDLGEQLFADLAARCKSVSPGSASAQAGGRGDRSPERDGLRMQVIDSRTFFGSRYDVDWLVHRMLAANQSAVFGGPREVLKTSTLIDLAVSLATATSFRFEPMPVELYSRRDGTRSRPGRPNQPSRWRSGISRAEHFSDTFSGAFHRPAMRICRARRGVSA
jgi:hypothetical protein